MTKQKLTAEELAELEKAHEMGVIDVIAFWASWRLKHETKAERAARLQDEFKRSQIPSKWISWSI
jgi:hypothetical protein